MQPFTYVMMPQIAQEASVAQEASMVTVDLAPSSRPERTPRAVEAAGGH